LYLRLVKLLFIGGTGNISAACTDLARRLGHEVWLVNRGKTHDEPLPEGVRELRADARNEDELRRATAGVSFDAVVQVIGYRPEHVAQDVRVFTGCTGQYVFISSTAAYEKPPRRHVVTEETPLDNPFWDYARDKIACEELLLRAHRESGFPVTIVRPSHTYGRARLPIWVGSWGTVYTIVDRMRRGQKVVVPGDGTALWTVTHSRDFAKGLVGLLGNLKAIGEAFHITSDEALAWNRIYEEIARAAGAKTELLHMASDYIAAVSPKDAGTLLGDKIHTTLFDNAKIKRFVPGFAATTPLRQGATETIAWFDADDRRRAIDHDANRRWDAIIARYEAARAG
jgi:nucleoside-diphosphate-sugar epimerase